LTSEKNLKIGEVDKMKDSLLKNIQLYPTEHFNINIDNLTRSILESKIDGNGKLDIKLLESRSKHIKSDITVSNLDKINVKFDEFHWAVLDACGSIIRDGYEYTTLAILRRKLGGAANKNSREDLHLDTDIKTAIEELAMIRISVDMQNTEKIYDSPLESGKYKFNGYLLPNESLEMSVNGQPATIYHFNRQSILVVTSEMKDQVITSNQEFFQPPIRMTRRSIAIHHFLLRRVNEMKGSLEASKTNKRVTPLRHTILLDSFYKACGLEDASRQIKQNARDIAVKILDFFKEKALIKGYTLETSERGKARAIHFEL
jgi:hypothetical protein